MWFLDALSMWLLCGIIALPMILIIEVATTMIRGPEFILTITKWAESRPSTGGWGMTALKSVIFWPFLLGMFTYAGFKRMTLAEWLMHEDAKRAASKWKMVSLDMRGGHLADDLRRVSGLKGTGWTEDGDFAPENIKGFLRLLGNFRLRWQEGEDGMVVVTHFVSHIPRALQEGTTSLEYMAFRVPSDVLILVPIVMGNEVEKVQDLCDKDYEWNKLCVTGHEVARDEMLKDHQKRVLEIYKGNRNLPRMSVP